MDDVDESVVYYWCNVRTQGSLKNRQAQALNETITAKGSTDRFAMELLPKSLDLTALGHKGPSIKESKATKARPLWNVYGTCFSPS